VQQELVVAVQQEQPDYKVLLGPQEVVLQAQLALQERPDQLVQPDQLVAKEIKVQPER
jgi:hypothetical protein